MILFFLSTCYLLLFSTVRICSVRSQLFTAFIYSTFSANECFVLKHFSRGKADCSMWWRSEYTCVASASMNLVPVLRLVSLWHGAHVTTVQPCHVWQINMSPRSCGSGWDVRVVLSEVCCRYRSCDLRQAVWTAFLSGVGVLTEHRVLHSSCVFPSVCSQVEEDAGASSSGSRLSDPFVFTKHWT